jgi:hypothetical protein
MREMRAECAARRELAELIASVAVIVSILNAKHDS